jgi:predicted DNA-binding transcriptional regulator AlpA
LTQDLAYSELSRDHLINRKQLRRIIPVSAMTIWRWERDGKLPRHLTIGRTSFWRAIEVRECLRGNKINPLATRVSPDEPTNIQRESLLFAHYQSALAIALDSGTVCDVQRALAAWQAWLVVNQPDESRRAAIPTPRLLKDIPDREGKPS